MALLPASLVISLLAFNTTRLSEINDLGAKRASGLSHDDNVVALWTRMEQSGKKADPRVDASQQPISDFIVRCPYAF